MFIIVLESKQKQIQAHILYRISMYLSTEIHVSEHMDTKYWGWDAKRPPSHDPFASALQILRLQTYTTMPIHCI